MFLLSLKSFLPLLLEFLQFVIEPFTLVILFLCVAIFSGQLALWRLSTPLIFCVGGLAPQLEQPSFLHVQ